MNNIHSQAHELADQMYQYYGGKEGMKKLNEGRPKGKYVSFMWLEKTIERRGEDWAFVKLSKMREYPHLNNGKKYPIAFILSSK